MQRFVLLLLLLSFLSCTSKEPSHKYDIEEKIVELGYTLPQPSAPVANYVGCVRTGNLIFLSGKGPRDSYGQLIKGKLGKDMTVEEGYQAAKQVALAQLGILKQELGDLNKIKRVIKVLGMVNATQDFTEHPEVINGFSDTLVEILGDNGKHARAAVGMESLPKGMALEIEMIVEVSE